MTATPSTLQARPQARVNRWGPWVSGALALGLLVATGYHRHRYQVLDAEAEQKTRELRQAQEALQRAAVEARGTPAGGLSAGLAAFGAGSPEIDALFARRGHHYDRAWQLGGPGVTLALVGLVWGCVSRRLGRATPAD